MNVALIAGAAGVAAAGFLWNQWDNSPGREAARLEAREAAIRQLIAEESAALVRHRAECQADGIELPAAAAVCWKSFDALAHASDRTVRGLTDELARITR